MSGKLLPSPEENMKGCRDFIAQTNKLLTSEPEAGNPKIELSGICRSFQLFIVVDTTLGCILAKTECSGVLDANIY